MSLLERELTIDSVKKICTLPLSLPDYQRPYRWSLESVLILFHDILNAYKHDEVDEYRLGSIILHKEAGTYYIVDGQQRMTTLFLLLYAIDFRNFPLPAINYPEESEICIIKNFHALKAKVNEIDNKKKFAKFIQEKCTLVKIVTDNEQEAFQFFDSQNSRGKGLKPHDLLKAYHLREFTNKSEENNKKFVIKWENISQKELAYFFESCLFPLTQWHKHNNGLYYSVHNIGVFKGIQNSNVYNFAEYHKYVNVHKRESWSFQLTQPLVSGETFFNYVFYYLDLRKKIELIVKNFVNNEGLGKMIIPCSGPGDRYTKELFYNALIFFVDKFNIDVLTKTVIQKIYTWCYMLRLERYAVYQESVNNYALGISGTNNLNYFEMLREMQDPIELDYITIEKVKEHEKNKKKYCDVRTLLYSINGW